MKYIKKLFENDSYYQDITDMMIVLVDTFDDFIDIDIHSDNFHIMTNFAGLRYTNKIGEEDFLENCSTFDEFINSKEGEFDEDGFKISFQYNIEFKKFSDYHKFYSNLLNILNSLDQKIEEFGYCVDPSSTGFGHLDFTDLEGICIGFKKNIK